MSESEVRSEDEPKIVTGEQARRAAKWFNYGTMVSLLLPLPLMIFWTGMSMLIYALNRHHPNPKVGHYTQQAAYRFYGVAGTLVVVANFFPVDWRYYAGAWAVGALILLPWSILDLIRINRDTWVDCVIDPEPTFEDAQGR
ncbi:MAG: hypothetical protein ACP5DC_05850 [Halothiobacillaceae bacterium]